MNVDGRVRTPERRSITNTIEEINLKISEVSWVVLENDGTRKPFNEITKPNTLPSVKNRKK